MNEPNTPNAASGSNPPNAGQPTIIIQQDRGAGRRIWMVRFLMFALVMSVLFNMGMYSAYQDYFATPGEPIESFHSGEELADEKIAVVSVKGTIIPPYTERILSMIEKAGKDDAVKGILLTVDSPGGLVADSHQIFHKLKELSKAKPVVVSMKRLATSGGLYVAMGAGESAKIFVEPTTWTGSIGVIIPRMDVSELTQKYGIKSEPLKTGPFKDALSPFHDLSNEERAVWNVILDDAFDRFLGVIAENRAELELEDVRKLATGQIYTATQAIENKLVDNIGYEEEALESLKTELGLEKVRVVQYKFQPGLAELLTGSVRAQDPSEQIRRWMDASVPRAMYFCSSWPNVLPAKLERGLLLGN